MVLSFPNRHLTSDDDVPDVPVRDVPDRTKFSLPETEREKEIRTQNEK